MKVKHVRALAYWAQDLRNRQLPVDDNGFDVAALDDAMIMLDTDNAANETDLKKPPKLKPDNWDTWEPKFVNYLKSLRRQTGTPLDFVIRDPIKTVNDFPATDEANRLIYAMALNGPVHRQDNHRVARELYSFVAGTSAANFVTEGSNDGRDMMTTLQNHCNGPGEVTKRYNKAKELLTHLHHKNELVFPWSEFISQLTKAFIAYKKAGRPLDAQTKMDYLMEKTQPVELAAVKEHWRKSQ